MCKTKFENNSNTNNNNQDSTNTDSDTNNNCELNVRQPSECKCTTDLNHVTIKFFNNETVVCLNNRDDRCVVNLSSYNLTETERSLLLKGLKFAPTPGEPNLQEIKQDLKAFFRKLKLRDFFYEEDESSDPLQPTLDNFFSQNNDPNIDLSKFKNPSTWEPDPQNVDPAIETFSRAVLEDFRQYTPRCPRDQNITNGEKDSLQSLVNKGILQIKKADKGSAVVIMNHSDYVQEAERQLSDINFYVKTRENLTEKHSEKISEILDRMWDNQELEVEHLEFLRPTKCRTSQFYFLPKIHKIQVKGRPIISGNGCPTERISAFVDEHIKQHVPTFPSYVKDTTDFIKKIRNLKTNKRIILVTMDVSSLYTNIPNHEGKTAIYRTLREQGYNGKASIESLMALLDCVLHMNNFEFAGENYLQIGGTSMGTRAAPSYACIYMSQLEKKLLKNAPHKPDLYLRFIDDIFCTFTTGMQQVEEFVTYMNSSHPTIKFTAEMSTEQVTFLDTRVKVDPETNEIYTELYTKDTDTQNYLLYNSSHPKHCKTGGPYGEFLRIRRNCHKLTDYDKHSENRVQDYLRRGYPLELLKEAQQKARNLNRDDLFKPKQKKPTREKDSRVPLIVTWNPSNPNFHEILNKHWHLLQLCSNKEIFKEPPLIVFRKAKNLSDHLVRAKCPKQPSTITTTPKKNPNMHPCKTPWNCRFCPKKQHRGKFQSSKTKRKYKSPPYTCNTRNVVYLITCNKCKIQYVGETYRSFKERMTEHERYVRRKVYSQATGIHFNTRGHCLGHMNYEVIFCLWKKPERNDPVRINKEIQWMEQLKTFKPDGLNERGK